MGRPPKFSRLQIQQEALKVVDRDGLGELTMRTVARALNTGPMTLYGHVRDRADLEILVVDAVFAEVELPAASTSPWQQRVEDISIATWTTIRRHPHTAQLVQAKRGQSHAALAVGESLASTLQRSGLSGTDLVIAFRTLLAIIIGGVEGDPEPERFDASFKELLGADPTDYPDLTTMLEVTTRMSPREIFRGTVRRAISGIEKSLAATLFDQ